MASAEKRQLRGKRRGAGQHMEVEAQEMKDSVKSPDYTERLAHKYMWKCTVESSTEESESESSVEVTPKSLSGGLKNARGSGHLQIPMMVIQKMNPFTLTVA
ncbi:uncharacterized protein LOC135190246 isoform X3 [Pogoniulus pusillus]|uniref:uncharacterized protein LOC135190246 isoform X3 n=1 Tax=Pogoniulus pusillus TaxID=488313 RepID=UPI0030B94573